MEDKSINVGKVAMTMGGNYDPSKAYDKLVCVHYNYRSWVSKKPVSEGIVPSEANSAFWQMISERGERGPQGQSYVDKELVPIVDDLTTGGSANVLSAEQGKVLKQELTELESEVQYVASVDCIIEDYAENSFVNANGTLVANDGFKVMKIKGNDIAKNKKITVVNTGCGGNGLYIVHLFNASDEQIGVMAKIDNDKISSGWGDLIIDLTYGYDDISYILVNMYPYSHPSVYVSRYINEPQPLLVSDVIESKKAQNNIQVIETSDYLLELYADNRLVSKNGQISSATYDGFKVLKLSGEIIDKKRKIYLRNVYNTGAGFYLVNLYDNNENLVDQIGLLEDNSAIKRGYNDIVIDLSVGGKYNNVAYAYITISNDDYPLVSIDKNNNNHEFYSRLQNRVIVRKNGIVGKDCDFNTIKDAVDYANRTPNTTIEVHPGNYDIIEEFGEDYMNTIPSEGNNYYGLVIGNGVKIVGQGANVNILANYMGDNDGAKRQFSIFNIVGSFSLKNISLVGQNIRYCVHEDNGSNHVDYVGQYRYVKMTHNGSNGTYKSVSCIGAGCTGNSCTIIDNCEFNDNFSDENHQVCVSFHNNYDSSEKAKVIITNCYFHGDQTFQTWLYEPTGSYIDVILNNNKFGQEVRYLGGKGDRITSLEYNNIIENTSDL